jgi:hypothetical protein
MRLVTLKSSVMAVTLGLLLSLAALSVRSTEWIHRSAWEPDHPAENSNDERVSVWGWPLHAAIDHPWQGRVGRLEPLRELKVDRLAANWGFFTLMVLYLRGFVAVFSRRGLVPQPIPAAVLSPLSVFLLVQVTLPVILPWGATSIHERVLDATFPSLLVAAAALVVLFVVGLPVTWALEHWHLFRPAVVLPLGALFGILPLVFMFFQAGEAEAGFVGLLFLAAASGGVCGLTYWFFAGAGRAVGAV